MEKKWRNTLGMNHSGVEAHAYLYTPTVLISWFSSLLLLPLTPNLRIQRLLPLCRSAAKCSHHSHNQTHPPPPNTLISHCAYQWSRYTLLHCQLRQWKAKVVVLSKGIEKTKLVPTLSVMTPREFIELLQQGAVSTQREAASLLSSSALQFML